MDETTLKVALAGFMHDMGKISDKESMDIAAQYIDNHAGLYLPSRDGHYSHHHAVYTAAFIEKMAPFLPAECNRPGWGDGDSFINLAAGHHDPQTPMQWIITVADRVSSGWERDAYDKDAKQYVNWRDYKKTRMLSLFEQIKLSSEGSPRQGDNFIYQYPLAPVEPETIFPVRKERDGQQMSEPIAEYRSLFEQMAESLKSLRHAHENPALWFEHFDSLMMRYASSIPSARVEDVIPDVSLYDHARITSALAAAIYRFHAEHRSLTIDAVMEDETRKLLLVGADFYGIQDFIFSGYGDTRKYRSKLLRGRSFAVSLLMELAADMACREMGLPHISVVLNAGGKFTLLSHNTSNARKGLKAAEERINDWLMRLTYGETGIGFSFVEASPADLVSGRFGKLWDRLGEAIAERKLMRINLDRYGGAVTNYLDSFVNTLKHPLCPICGKRPSSRLAEGDRFVGDLGSACSLCRDHIYLGTNLATKQRLAVSTTDAMIEGSESRLLEPIFDEYQVSFPAGDLNEAAEGGRLLRFWDLGEASSGITSRYIKGYVPVYGPEDLKDDRILVGRKSEARKFELIEQIKPGDPKTLHYIAAMSKKPDRESGKYTGVEVLGILKADVDHLGMLMSCGLKPERFTFSRLATLSRQLNWFFALFLPHLLMMDKRFKDIYTVFAGGDDLFLIGPWNYVIDLAMELRDRFHDYVCGNEEVHFSAGISLMKPMTPIDSMAEGAEHALHESKRKRNALTVFSQTVTWNEMDELLEIRAVLEKWLGEGWINQSMLHRLNKLIQMAGEERRLVGQRKDIMVDDLACTRWRFMLAYTCGRNVAKNLRSGEREKALAEVKTRLSLWLSQYGEKLVIPLWTVLYENR